MADLKITDFTAELVEDIHSKDNQTSEVSNLSKIDIHPDDVELTAVKSAVMTIDTTDKRPRRLMREEYTFAAKKTVAQGMMDVALITANANQLRYLVEYQRQSPTFFVIVFLIVISLLLQIAVGVSLIFKGRFDMKGMSKSPGAKRINNYMVVGIFLITIINVFIAAFNISGPMPTVAVRTGAKCMLVQFAAAILYSYDWGWSYVELKHLGNYGKYE